MQTSLPFLYHPTTVLLVDDNISYLKQLKSLLSKNPLKVVSENSPFDALDIIRENVPEQTLIHSYLHYPEEEEFETYRVLVNVPSIYKTVYNHYRFEQISTVVVDYNMPGMTGIEFCKKIKDLPIKKILLTGDADEKIALDAFNQGLIDAYVQKQVIDFHLVIKDAIEKCQESYFQDFSRKIEAAFNPEEKKKTPFYSEEFKSYFKKVVQDQKIKEFYLLERSGSFLCLDEEGNHGVLATSSKETMEPFFESQEAVSADPKVINRLKNGSHILCYKHLTDTPLPQGSKWSEYVFEADSLTEDGDTFLCAYIPGKFGLPKSDLMTFKQSKALR